MVFSLFVEGEFFFLSHRSFGLRTYGLREVRKWIPNKITYNISITSLNERFSIYMFSTVCFIKPYRNMVYKCHPFTFLSPPLYFSQSPLYFPQSPLSFSCGRTYSKQLPWPCYPSLPSIRYEHEFRGQALSLYNWYIDRGPSVSLQLWSTQDGGQHCKFSCPPIQHLRPPTQLIRQHKAANHKTPCWHCRYLKRVEQRQRAQGGGDQVHGAGNQVQGTGDQVHGVETNFKELETKYKEL